MQKLNPIPEKRLHKLICEYIKWRYPDVLFNTDMSGIKLTMGQAIQAKKLRSCNGWPDIFIAKKKGVWSGLFLEVKRAESEIYKKDFDFKSKHIEEQFILMDKLRKEGFQCVFVWDFEKAIAIINEYLHK